MGLDNITLPTSILAIFFYIIIGFCVVGFFLTCFVAFDLYTYLSNRSDLKAMNECRKFIDGEDVLAYKECMLETIKLYESIKY